MKLGEFVVKYRTEHDLSQRKFAEECGLSNGYISMIEKSLNPQTGTKITPSLPALKKLATGMRLSVSALLEEVDDIPVELSVKPNVLDNGWAKKKIPPKISDKGIKVVCKIDSSLYDNLCSLAESDNRSFEDELEYLLFWAVEAEIERYVNEQ